MDGDPRRSSNGFPTAMGFRCYHIKHHSHLSAYDYDADVPSHWEVEWVGDSGWRKALWMFFSSRRFSSRVCRG